MNIKSYITFLSRNKVYTAINVFGLSVSLMFVMLIGVYVWQEYSVDRQHSKAERIYTLGIDMGGDDRVIGVSRQVAPYLKSRYPEIEMTCGVAGDETLIYINDYQLVKKYGLYVDSTFFQIFDFPLVKGDCRSVLRGKDDCVVTEDLARQLFGDSDPIGKHLKLGYYDKVLKVTGVMKEMENSSLQKADFVCRFEHVSNESLVKGLNNAVGSDLYVLAKPNTDFGAKAADITQYFKEFFWIYQLEDMEAKAIVLPFSEQYFTEIRDCNRHTSRGSLKLVKMLFASCLVVLLFAVFNYINLTVAQSGRRSREMAMRRLLGSHRSGIVRRLMFESIMLCLFSLALSLLFAAAFAPFFSQLLETKLLLAEALTPLSIGGLLLFALLLGAAAGVFPAVVISRAEPIEVVRGTFAHHTRMVFSRVFIVLQNVITIVMIAVALTMSLQMHHIISAPMGFNKDNVVVLRNTGDSIQASTFCKEVEKLACVKLVSASMGTPSDGGNNSTMTLDSKKTVSLQILFGDRNFLEIYGLKPKKENTDGSNIKLYVTEQTLREMGNEFYELHWENMLGDRGKDINPHACGVLNDFHIRNIEEATHPMLIFIKDKIKYPWNFSVLITGNPIESFDQIKNIYRKVYNFDMPDEYPFIDQQISAYYTESIRLSHIVSLFATMALLVSLLGLVAMSTYFIQQRQKEIAVRKVFGSSSSQVCRKLIRTFLAYVAIAFIIAIPVIWYLMSDWLSQFSYRITLSPLIFLAAGAICFLISLLSTIIQSWVAANENPIKYIKDN
ncbi:MAG: ABC transporter permease [Prevotella sp.]|nr:ABC transporter permease [Prevotella sp.]